MFAPYLGLVAIGNADPAGLKVGTDALCRVNAFITS